MPGYWNFKIDSEVEFEITSQLSISNLSFIGRYIKQPNGIVLFDNIRLPNFSPLPKIKSNVDDKLINTKVLIVRNDLINSSYYHFIFQVENESLIFEYKPDVQEFTNSIYERFDKADSANNNDISKALNTITYQINKKPETFIYELIQNADDNAGDRDVNVNFFITDKYLLVSHNGAPFRFNNVFAICSVNAEDKSEDIDKIGFKGIGFKSVFKDNDWVFIKSGGYNFRFDQTKYSVEKPWQLMPIWTPIDEELEISLRNNERFLSENVSIALRPNDNNVKLLSKYSKTLELFNDDRILLFLKKVRQVHVSLQNKEKIHCRKNIAIWDIKDYTVNVKDDIKFWLNEQIRNNNQEVPSKYQDIQRFKISYAYRIEKNKVIPLVDSTLFNYLPLSISLGFPFLVNSDFIPEGDREELYLNVWNEFLMIEIGKYLPVFISDLVGKKVDCFNLLPDLKVENLNNSKWGQLYKWFSQGFEESLIGQNAIAFIPTQCGTLETISNILIDETGLADLLGEDFFKLTGIKAKLINSEVGEGIEKIKAILSEDDQGVYTIEKLKVDIKSKFGDWLKIPQNNFKIIHHFYASKNLKGLLETEAIILTTKNILGMASDVYESGPDLVDLIDFKRVNDDLLILLTINNISLNLKVFNPVDFYNENIWGKHDSINKKLDNEIDLLNFWNFIYDYWNEFGEVEGIKVSIKLFKILCKSLNNESLYSNVITTVYLSAGFNTENEIESVITEIGIQDAKFISEKYISEQRNAAIWYRVFKQAQAITDLQKVIEVLLPRLSKIETEKHFQIAKQIFKFWKVPTNKLTDIQIGIIKTDLKIKTADNAFRKTNDCIISDHFNNNQLISSWLPDIELVNQVAQEYAPKTNQVAEWKNFFEIIGCVELTDKQNVFDAKINFIIASQDTLKDNHFEILKSISDLFKLNKENGLIFDFEKTLSQIKLQTNNDQLHLPVSIHLSSSYKPKLNLENDDIINSKLLFLNEKYLPNEIEKFFFIKLGVKNNFSFNNIEIVSFENFENLSIKDKLFNSENFNVKKNTLLSRGYNIKSIEAYTKFKNHVQCYFLSVPVIQKYNSLFFDEVVKLNDKFFNHTELINNQSSCGSCHNELINFIRENETIENKLGVFVKPSMLFSSKLEKYIDDKSLIPKNNLLCTEFKSEKSIAEIIGIYQELSIELCLYLLSNPSVELTFKEIQELNVVKILSNYRPKEEGDTKIFMLNKIAEWKSINELLISNDEKIKIEPSQQLHEDFLCLADNFGVQELSERSLILITKPEKPLISYEINEFFEKKAKYIAFKIDPLNFEVLETEIIERIVSIKFYEAEFISKVFPEYNPIYNVELDFSFEEEEKIIFYKDNWKTNIQVIEFLFNQIKSEKVEYAWFKNIISWDDKKIIETLINISDSVPNDWMNIDSKEGEDEEEAEFLKFYREGLTRAKAHWRSLANHGESFNDYFLKTFTDVLQSNKSLKLGTQISNDLSKKDQKEANREAKVIVKEKLESEGFEFTNGIDEFSTINGVKKEGIEYPLVVKSYKNQDEPLKIGANEWIQLMHPNSMFWVYFGNDKIACLKLNELLRKQDNLTISFSTENLDVENRLEKFAELLRYFGDVHFDFHSVKPNNYSTATVMGSYQFTERKTEEDLSRDDQELL